jgi:hypothetical protein
LHKQVSYKDDLVNGHAKSDQELLEMIEDLQNQLAKALQIHKQRILGTPQQPQEAAQPVLDNQPASPAPADTSRR